MFLLFCQEKPLLNMIIIVVLDPLKRFRIGLFTSVFHIKNGPAQRQARMVFFTLPD